MRKVIATLSLVLVTSLFVPHHFAIAAAQYDPFKEPCSADTGDWSEFCGNVEDQKTKDRVLGSDGIITKATQFIIYLAGALSVIMVVFGGLKYILSNGDANGTKQAKDTIMYALIGLAVAILAQAIVVFVLSKL